MENQTLQTFLLQKRTLQTFEWSNLTLQTFLMKKDSTNFCIQSSCLHVWWKCHKNVTRYDISSFFNQQPPYQRSYQQWPCHITQWQPHHHTMSNNPHHWKTNHAQGLKANTAPNPATHKWWPPTRMQNGDECPGTTPTAHHQDPRTTTGVHKHWQWPHHHCARSTAATTTHKLQALPPTMNGKPPSDKRKTAHNPGKATVDKERPPQSLTHSDGHAQMQTTTTTLNWQHPPPPTSYEH